MEDADEAWDYPTSDAQKSLADAVKSGSAAKLQSALATAEREGVRGPEVRHARDALLSIEALEFRQYMDKVVENAIEADDAWKLQAAMQKMVCFGISGEQLDRLAEAMKTQRKRQGAAQEIAKAAEARDTSRLRTAIEVALKAHAKAGDVKRAREVLRALEAHASAKRAIKEALVGRDTCRLKAALEESLRAGLHQPGPGDLKKDPEGKELLAALRSAIGQQTARKLQQLYEEGDAGKLGDALAEASSLAEPGSKTIADFTQKLERLRRRQSCQQELDQALRLGEVGRLAAAIQAAEASGLGEVDVKAAKETLKATQEREQGAAARDHAMEELRLATTSEDAGRVAEAISAAEAAGLGGPEAAHARERLRLLRGKSGAARELEEAVSSGDVYRLRAALATARGSGVCERELRQAQDALQKLKEQAQARRGLEAAVASGDAEFMQRSIEAAKLAGLGRQELGRVEAALRELRQSQVGGELSEAMASGSAEQLSAAARAAADAGVSGCEVDAAWERIRELESHSWLRRQLATAVASGDAARLQAAIKQAEAGHLDPAEVQAAHAKLDACHAELRAQQELQLARASGGSGSFLQCPLSVTPTPVSNTLRKPLVHQGSFGSFVVQKESSVGQRLQPSPPVAVRRAPSTDAFVPGPRDSFVDANAAIQRRAVQFAL